MEAREVVGARNLGLNYQDDLLNTNKDEKEDQYTKKHESLFTLVPQVRGE